jgi:LysM repeat protein
MRKLFLTLFFMGGIFLLLSPGEVLWSKRRFLDEPRVHKVQKGESLSKLAKQYYGDPKRWRELALINRAPKPGHLEVGEEVLLPSATVISELRRTRTLTRANALLARQENAAAAKGPEVASQPAPANAPTNIAEPASPVAQPESNDLVPETTPETITSQEHSIPDESGFPWFWLAIGVIMIAGAAGFIWYRRQQAKNADVEAEMVPPRRNFDDRSRERQAFTKPAREQEKANLTM